jgi:hypothetical protein
MFEDVATTLQTSIVPEICARSEKSTTGIDVLRSTIFNGDGDRIFLQQQLMQVLAVNSKQFFALDGSLTECANGALRIREDARCGCPEHIISSIDGAVEDGVALVGEEDLVVEPVVDEVAALVEGEAAVIEQGDAPLLIDVNTLVTDEEDETTVVIDEEEMPPNEDVSTDDQQEEVIVDDPTDDQEASTTADDLQPPVASDESSLETVDDASSNAQNVDDSDTISDDSQLSEETGDDSSDIFDDVDDDDEEIESTSLLWLLLIIPAICLLICFCVLCFTSWGGRVNEKMTVLMKERANARIATPTGQTMHRGSIHLDAFQLEVPPQPATAATPAKATPQPTVNVVTPIYQPATALHRRRAGGINEM